METCSADRERIARSACELDPDRFRLRELADCIETALAADAARAEAAERYVRGDDAVGVDPHGAGANARRHAMCAPDVERPHAGGEPVDAVVRERDRLVLVIERKHAENRAEDFFPHDPRVAPDACQDGRPHEVAARLSARAAAGERGTLARRLVEEGPYLLELSGVC